MKEKMLNAINKAETAIKEVLELKDKAKVKGIELNERAYYIWLNSVLYRLAKPTSSLNLSGEDLSNLDLSFKNFETGNFKNTNLEDSNLTYANLADAYINGANLEGVNLSGTTLTLFPGNVETLNLYEMEIEDDKVILKRRVENE